MTRPAQPLYQPRLGSPLNDAEEVVGFIPPRCACGIAHARPKYAEWTEPEPEGESFWAALAVFVLLVASLVALSYAIAAYQ